MVVARRSEADSREVATIREALRCGRSGCGCASGPNVHCPAHDDARPSLTVRSGARQLVVVHCQRGCSQQAVIDALKARGLWNRPSHNGTHRPSPKSSQTSQTSATAGPPVAVYDYRAASDPTGPVVAQKGRWETPTGKTFRWRRTNVPGEPGSSGWSGLDGISLDDLALWGAEMIADRPDEPVVIVEGEKAALAARSLGLLAVCHPGGASTRRFAPAQLAPLSGRDVILWPDNDAPGQEYMHRLAVALRGIARTVRFLTPPLPPRGDAADYVAAGGTAEALLADLPPARPDLIVLGRESYRVRVPTPAGCVTLEFRDVEQTGRKELEAEISISVGGSAGGDGSTEPLVQRLNLLSGSQRTDLRRDLDALYGREYGWTAVLAVAMSLVRRAYGCQERAVRVDQILDPGEPQFLVDLLLPEGSPTVLFGDGSSGKTYLALALALAVATGRPFCGYRARQGPVLYVDYETSDTQFRLRIGRLCRGLGLDGVPPGLPIYYWPAGGVPVAEQVEVLRRFCAEAAIVFVIVDAAADACGGEPESAEVASRYFNALSRLGSVTTLTIAHIAKGSDTEKPFGSVVWHNRPRRTWYVQRVQDEDADEADIGLYCRKSNDGHRPSPIAFRITFSGATGPVTIERGDLSAVPELAERRPLRDRIRDALAHGSLSVTEIVDALGGDVPRESVKRTLLRFPNLFVQVSHGGGRGKETHWGLRARHDQPTQTSQTRTRGDPGEEADEPWWTR